MTQWLCWGLFHVVHRPHLPIIAAVLVSSTSCIHVSFACYSRKFVELAMTCTVARMVVRRYDGEHVDVCGDIPGHPSLTNAHHSLCFSVDLHFTGCCRLSSKVPAHAVWAEGIPPRSRWLQWPALCCTRTPCGSGHSRLWGHRSPLHLFVSSQPIFLICYSNLVYFRTFLVFI